MPPTSTVRQNIYRCFIDKTELKKNHRDELRAKRGFTGETIGKLLFRSGYSETVNPAVAALQDKFEKQELIDAGILVEANGVAVVNQQLIDGRIIIPYLDEQGNIYHIRPHKLGFTGMPPEVYCRFFLAGNPERVVLTEGEFKAAALWQAGIPAIAVPGVSSFAGKHFERLVEVLKEFGVKQVVVVFDNEVKDNPAYPNYKERPDERYDTQFWAYMMAYKLGREGFAARVGWLPDEWRADGKADWDSALAAGHTREEFLAVIDRTATPKEFLEALSEEAQRIVRRKLARQFAKLPVRREYNHYLAERHKGDQTWEEPISNFVINIRSSFFTPDGVVRNVELINEYGEKSEVFALEPQDMAGLDSWKKFVYGKGNYIFEGTGNDLINVWKLEFLRDVGDLVYMPDMIGRINSSLWLFGNMAIHNGKIYRPDNDGIIWIKGKGYKPQSLQIGPRGEPVEEAIPALSEQSIDIQEVADKLRQSVGGYEAYIGIGWVIATIFSQDIFQHYRCTPILFAHGKRESGKSTFLGWLMNFFGIETEGIGIAETSQNFIARALSYYSSLGAWFDEYRNETKVIQKDGFFRSAYNRQFSGKGTATAFQAKGFAVHGAVAISGEELPKDNGLFTRCVPVQMSAYRWDRSQYSWINRYASRFSYLTLWLLQRYDKLKPKIMENIADLRQALLDRDISDRTAGNWAICAAAFDTVVMHDPDFIKWVLEECREIRQSAEQEHMLNQFWEDVDYLVSNNTINPKTYFRLEGNMLYAWVNGLYEEWAIHYRKKTGREPFDRASIMKYLQEEKYCKGKEVKRFGNILRKVCVIDTKEAPEAITEITSMIEVPLPN
jgi:DNA primase